MSASQRSGRRRGAYARAGLDASRAARELARVGLVPDVDADPEEHVADLLEVVSVGADPEDALLALSGMAAHRPEMLAAVRADPDWLERVAAVAGASRPLGELLARTEGAAEALANLDPVRADDIARRVRQAVEDADDDEPARAAAVAGIRRRATADVAARDLTGSASVEEVARELAQLAEGVLDGALAAIHGRVAAGSPRARLAVIGMGKLGGSELNYVSDVDVVFVHESVAGTDASDDEALAAADEARQVFTELLTLLNASTTMGRAYEVDPTLRPEGRRGPLSRPVASFVAYWERWAETWEFQALLKARVVAGDRALGTALLDAARPFVYPDRLDPAVVAEIRRMKGRVEAKPEVQRDGDRQVKLGPGGLRDIEFAVQLLQLVHGRADPSLRETGTLPALEALARGGYIAEEDASSFARAYRTLRQVEHHLQLANERRTHTIPGDQPRQERLARSLGYRATTDAAARDPFLRDLRAVQATVRDLHGKLFYRPLLESHAAVPVDEAEVSRMRGLDDTAAVERLTALGFRDGAAALRDVRALAGGVTRSARTLRVVLPTFLHHLAQTPDPDVGLGRFRDLVTSQSANQAFLGRLRDHPPTISGLAHVLGTSEVAAELLLAQPQGIEWFDLDVTRGATPDRDEVVGQAVARLQWQDPFPALRRFKRHLLLRTVLRDLLADAPVGAIADELTVIAEALLEAGLRSVLTEVAMERGGSRGEDLPLRMAVIGMGKLGGSELHYVSDLDVMFVHQPVAGADRSDVHTLANEVAGRLVAALGAVTAEGTAFEVDADLRPEGRGGPLSRSLESFEAYWDRWAEPWEFQALTRARFVAGDAEVGDAFLERSRSLAFPASFSSSAEQRMRRMKARMEKERIGPRQDPKRHLKLGPGGISDVEWTVQLLQQRHGASRPGLRSANTMRALDVLQDESLLDHRDAAWLRDGYHFLSRVRNRLYLLRHRDVDVLPSSTAQVSVLAHTLGYGPTGHQSFEDDYLRHTRHVRRVAERVFFEVPDVEARSTWNRS